MATLIEKILRRNTGKKDAKPGDIVTAKVDRVMVHDIFIPFVADKFEEMGFTKVWDPDRMVLVYDHMVPASQVGDVRHFPRGDAFARKYGIKNVHRTDGICHQLMAEKYVQPGDVVLERTATRLPTAHWALSPRESATRRWRESWEPASCGFGCRKPSG